MPDPRSLYFHEDDDSQIELLPLAAWAHCERTLAQLHDFAEAHFDGSGYTDLMVRPEAPQSLGDLGLAMEPVEAAAAARFPAYAEVWTGYSSSRTPCPMLRAWGEHDFALFADHREGRIEALWLSHERWAPEQAPAIAALLRALPKSGELLLVDWPWGHLFALSDAPALERWLAERTAPWE
ncbi:hypothetical protein J5226_22025 [Lysobacter sp. K5869]|uniref:hypothetical protein n=1 Tax=Lysobacter sp. K5869 TaxID=2820808 RepID=UPI001C062180|nr:hypothetical protein [Lysobacter sp. K5869]QWP76235.1 hypothetical protein J5226_22025 [Lysobacter sp. K5869]